MKGWLPMSLNLRLWAVVLVAVLPIFTIVVLDYQAQRRELAGELEADVLRMLSVSEQQEALANWSASPQEWSDRFEAGD